jgi:hypothetical protein
MEINEKEMQNIRTLYDELLWQQNLEFSITSNTGLIDKTITKYAGSPSLYTQPKKMESLVSKLDNILLNYDKKATTQGKLLSEKALDSFMTNQERISKNAKQKTLIKKLSKKRADKRLSIYSKQLSAESKYMKAQIDAFVSMQRNMGRSSKVILQDLVDAGNSNLGFTQAFKAKVKSINVTATRIDKGQAEIDNYKLFTKPGELWQWISVSKKPCNDCKARAGVILPYRSLQRIGLPRSGNTICGGKCLCRVYPLSIAEDKFPTVKEFRWNSDDLVLTSPREAKLLIKGSK